MYESPVLEIYYLLAHVRGHLAVCKSIVDLVKTDDRVMNTPFMDTTVGELIKMLNNSNQELSDRLIKADDYARYLEQPIGRLIRSMNFCCRFETRLRLGLSENSVMLIPVGLEIVFPAK